MNAEETRPEGPLTLSIEKLRGELDRWLETALSQGNRAMDAIGIRTCKSYCPPVDVVEESDQIRVYIDLPGVASDLIELTLVGNMLTVSGVIPDLDLPEGAELHDQERAHGEFKRSIPLPSSVDPENVKAESHHGVLVVTVAKSESEKIHKIPVHSEKTSPASSSRTQASQ